MAIETILNNILNEPYMKNMRQSIVDGIEQVYKDATAKGDTNMEVMRARGSESSLNDRLDKNDTTHKETTAQLAQTMTQTEFDSWVATLLDGGPSIFFDTLSALNTAYPQGADGVALVRATDPAKIYVWNGSSWEDFGDYQGLEIKNGTVAPEKTTFAKKGKGKNKFDGIYTKGVVLSGEFPNNISYVSSSQVGTPNAGFCAVLKLEENKTYTITLGDDADRYGVAVFIGEPIIGAKVNRALHQSTTKFTEKTITLSSGENHLVIYTSSTTQAVPPTILQVEEGIYSTEFEGYEKLYIPLTKESIPKIGYNMTDFAQKGRNLFNGVYTEGLIVTGSSSFSFSTGNTGAKSVIFEGVAGKTYSLSRSNDANRYTIATSAGFPTSTEPVLRVLNEATISWTERTVELQGSEKYIIAYVSNVTESKTPTEFQIEEGLLVTAYTPPNSIKINAETSLIERKQKKIVHFGDSQTEIRNLPELVGRKTGHETLDVSFSGAPLSYHSDISYNTLGFASLVNSIVSNDYTLQENTLTFLETQGGSNKRPNFNTLKSIDWFTVDCIVVFAGTNDFGASASLEVFGNLFKTAIQKMNQKYPNVQIYVVTPIYRPSMLTNSLDLSVKDYAYKMVDVAKECHFTVLNLYDNSGINEFNYSYYLDADKLHFNPKGVVLTAEKIGKFIDSH